MEIDEIIRKLRKMKKYECALRGLDISSNIPLVWDEFFSTKKEYDLTVKYCLNILKNMDHERRKEAFEEYYFQMFYRFYKDNHISISELYNTNMLEVFGLSAGASIEDIKKRFRELAKKYHPDHGGDHEKMIELLEAYKKIME
ncbi:MAG: J domain-containing protein [Bacillota bacterium]